MEILDLDSIYYIIKENYFIAIICSLKKGYTIDGMESIYYIGSMDSLPSGEHNWKKYLLLALQEKVKLREYKVEG